jgi:hypothetical protein
MERAAIDLRPSVFEVLGDLEVQGSNKDDGSSVWIASLKREVHPIAPAHCPASESCLKLSAR